jgi:CDP-glycerol glycerophosphotransferase
MILIRLHPSDKADGLECLSAYSNVVIDATRYPDMQELILASDAFFSDYSSCIFDAALCDIPCFTYANDFAAYKGDRGVYYEMEELPFPYAKSNDELVENILNFNYELYKKKWEAFKIRTGLLETGHAAKDIANAIDGFIKEGRNIQIP